MQTRDNTLYSIVLFFLFFSFQQTKAVSQCNAPSNTYNLGVQINSADIAWTFVNGARYYKVRYRIVGTSSWTNKRTRDTDVSIFNLSPGSDYEWKVKTKCWSGSSGYSNLNYFTTLSVCPTPSPFTPLGVGSHQATLVWLNINNQVDSYNVRWREKGTSNWNVINGISTNLYIVYDLDPLTKYEYQVQSNCGNITSPYSVSVEWSTPKNVCTAPQNLLVTNVGIDFVSLSWSAVGGSGHYRVRYRELGSSNWMYKDFIGGTSTTIQNLFPNTVYESQVQSECTLGPTDWSSLVAFTTLQIQSCDAPLNLFATMITATSARHNWDPVTGALSYTIRRRITGTQIWTFIHTTTETNVVTFLLDPGTGYEFQVLTHCTIGDSPYSQSSFYTTQGDPSCPVASNLFVDDITPTSADFSWDLVVGILHYKLEWKVLGTSSWSSVTTTSNSISRTGLFPGTNYEWRVQTLCTSGGSYTISPIETFMTAPAGQCTTPSGLFVLGVGQTQATLLWGSIPEANNYDARIRPTGTSSWTTYNGISSNLKVVFGLTSNTEYEFQVQANCASGSSGYSTSDVFTTQSGSGGGLSGSISTGTKKELDLISNLEIQVYPNPALDYIFIESVEGVKEVTLVDLVGRQLFKVVYDQTWSRKQFDLSTYNIQQGVYWVRIKTENHNHDLVKKLIIN